MVLGHMAVAIDDGERWNLVAAGTLQHTSFPPISVMAAAVASLVVSVPRVSRVRAARRAPAPARPTLAVLGARPQRASQRRVAAAAKAKLGGEDEEGNVKITRDREPEEVRPPQACSAAHTWSRAPARLCSAADAASHARARSTGSRRASARASRRCRIR
jgi:hypothetical protein